MVTKEHVIFGVSGTIKYSILQVSNGFKVTITTPLKQIETTCNSLEFAEKWITETIIQSNNNDKIDRYY